MQLAAFCSNQSRSLVSYSTIYKGLVLHLLVGLLPMTLFAICSEKHTAIKIHIIQAVIKNLLNSKFLSLVDLCLI